ncbi:hypothetical protein [Streptomyces sp. 8L]|nr:hypothetical protein [Streptomyces sp. 8L]
MLKSRGPRKPWTSPERWQVVLGCGSFVIAAIALMEQFAQH